MDKLPEEVVVVIWALRGSYDIEVKVGLYEADKQTISNIGDHTEQGVEQQQKLDDEQPKENFVPWTNFISHLLCLVITLGKLLKLLTSVGQAITDCLTYLKIFIYGIHDQLLLYMNVLLMYVVYSEFSSLFHCRSRHPHVNLIPWQANIIFT